GGLDLGGLQAGNGGLQASAHADRFDAAGEARLVVGLHEDAADRRRTLGGLVAAARDLGGEPAQRLVLLVADHTVVVGAGAGVGLVGGAAGQDLGVGGGHVGVGAHHQAGPTVAPVAHGHLLGADLGVHVDDDRVGHGAQRRGLQLTVHRGEGI